MDTQENTHTKEFIVLMAALMAIVALTIDALLPALGVISSDLAVENRNHTQFLIGGIFAGMAVGQLIAGPLSDALGRKNILYAGITIYLIGGVIGYCADTLELLLAGRLIQGIGVAGPYVSAVSIVRDKYAGRQMAKIMSVIMMIFMTVPALAPSIGQVVMNLSYWRGIFLLYIGYGLALVVWIVFRLEETLPRERRIPFHVKNIAAAFREVIGTRTTVCYMICAGISFGGLIGYLNSSQQIFQDQFMVGEMFSVYFGVGAVMIAIASLANSRIVVRLGMRYICFRAFAGIAATSAAFLMLQMFVEIELWMFFTYALCLLFFFGFTFGNLNALAMEPMGHIAGIAAAVVGATSSVISMTLGTVIGQMYDGTLVPMTTGFLLLSFCAMGMMRLAGRG